MKILKQIRKSIRNFNEHTDCQKIGALRFLELQDILDVDLNQPREVDFFFYAEKKKNASNLKLELEKKGFLVEKVHQVQNNVYSICGTAFLKSLAENEFLDWVIQMNELAFINDCDFDGWGMISRFGL